MPRYEIENFLIDPLVVYAALLDVGQAPGVDGLEKPILKGEEGRMRNLAAGQLQEIADAVLREVALEVPKDWPSELVPVSFTNGATLQYPKWLKSEKGKELLVRLFGRSQRVITTKSLLSAFESVRLMPEALRDCMRELI